MEIWWERLASFSSAFFRLALGASFLSAVADRFGLWGQFGQPNVSWGNFSRFVEYTGRLNWFLPHPIVSALAVIVTFAEVLLGLLLLVGWKARITALCAGILVMIFRMAMTAALGVEAPLQRFRVFGRRSRHDRDSYRMAGGQP
jgi:uncharacterized membrane protein YphA (DoxX/SURF4 family)